MYYLVYCSFLYGAKKNYLKNYPLPIRLIWGEYEVPEGVTFFETYATSSLRRR